MAMFHIMDQKNKEDISVIWVLQSNMRSNQHLDTIIKMQSVLDKCPVTVTITWTQVSTNSRRTATHSITTSLTRDTLESGISKLLQQNWVLSGTHLVFVDNGVSIMFQKDVLNNNVPFRYFSTAVPCLQNNTLKTLLLMLVKMMLLWYSPKLLVVLITLDQTTRNQIDSKEMETK